MFRFFRTEKYKDRPPERTPTMIIEYSNRQFDEDWAQAKELQEVIKLFMIIVLNLYTAINIGVLALIGTVVYFALYFTLSH